MIMSKKFLNLGFFVLASISLIVFFQNTTPLTEPELIPLEQLSVNAPALWQDPVNPSLFWGRRHYYNPNARNEDVNDESTWKFRSLALYRLDENNRKINFIRYVSPGNANTRIHNGTKTLHTAMDPAVIDYNGTKYIAFECHGPGFEGSSNACIGELDTQGQLIPTKTRVIVKGLSFGSDSHQYYSSGSVPKLLKWRNKVYLSWSAVKQNRSLSGIESFESIATRGMEIVLHESDGMWHPANNNNSPAEHDPSYSNGPNTVDIFNAVRHHNTADLFSLYSINDQHLISTAAVGRCTRPIPCYNFSIRKHISAPENILVTGFVNHFADLNLQNMPPNTHEYIRPIKTRTGGLALLGKYLDHQNITGPRKVPEGMYLIRHPQLESLPTERTQSLNGIQQLTHRLYQEFLEMNPTENDTIYLKNLARQGLSCTSIIETFAEDHAARIQSLAPTIEEQVHRIYWSALGRGPESDRIVAHYVNIIKRNGFIATLSAVLESREARLKCDEIGSLETENTKTWVNMIKNKHRIITRTYEEALARTPTLAELNSWNRRATNLNMSCSQIQSAILSSNEFQREKSMLANMATIQRLYWSLLGRSAASEDLQRQMVLWRQKGYQDLLNVILNSPEARNLCRQENI